MTRANPLDAALDDFEVVPTQDRPRADPEAIAQVAKENGFVSRDARKIASATKPAGRTQRRYTTGRNQQLNIKATADTIARFNAIAEKLGIPAGAVLELAVEALEERRQSK